MRIAFAVTKTSELLLSELLDVSSSNWVDVYTNNEKSAQEIENLGVSCIYIPEIPISDKRKKDKAFQDDFMPGILADMEMKSFPIWKSLAMDRFRFWYNPNYSSYDFSHYDVCYYSLDVLSTFPWIIDANRRIGIKIGNIRERTVLDFINSSYFDEVIVSFDDEQFLSKKCKSRAISRLPKPELNNSALREIHSGGKKIIGVVFDKQNDWQYRRFFDTLDSEYLKHNYYVSIVIDERSGQLISSCASYGLEVQGNEFISKCDTVIDFAFHENIVNDVLGEYVILDYSNVNKANSVAAGLPKVKVFN